MAKRPRGENAEGRAGAVAPTVYRRHPEERPLGRVSKDDGQSETVHPSRLATLAPQDDGPEMSVYLRLYPALNQNAFRAVVPDIHLHDLTTPHDKTIDITV